MNVIISQNIANIYPNTVETYDQLPLGYYTVGFDPMKGFFLVKNAEPANSPKKIYGKQIKKIDKILRSFSLVDKNLGVLLAGEKGSGKSIFAKELAKKSLMPVIFVNNNYPGLVEFLNSIEQEVVVIFDEFEKTFNHNKENGCGQTNLLTLFDGILASKKLFIIITNEIGSINDYYLNRPGRFHYLLLFDSLSAEEIKEYVEDNLENNALVPQIVNELNKIVLTTKLNYDILSAICFDLNCGFSIQETLEDLNLMVNSGFSAKYIVKLKNNDVFYTCLDYTDLNDLNQQRVTVNIEGSFVNVNKIYIKYFNKDVFYNEKENLYVVNPIKALAENKDGEKVEIEYIKIKPFIFKRGKYGRI